MSDDHLQGQAFRKALTQGQVVHVRSQHPPVLVLSHPWGLLYVSRAGGVAQRVEGVTYEVERRT